MTCVLLAFLAFCPPAASVAHEGKQRQPNILLILIDDLGWRDLGCYGNPLVETPNIDSLARQGMRFTDFYAAGAVCSPTRCAIQSGQNQARIGITAHIPGHWRPFERVITPRTTMALPLDTVTIAETLQAAGYATGYVGKWHLGNAPQFQPHRQGYQWSGVINGPHLPGRYRVQGNVELEPKTNQYRTDFEADLSIEFIRRHKEQPFFLMLSPYAVHIPLAAMSEKVEKYRKKSEQLNLDLPHPVYAAMIEHCDDMVGRILGELERLELAEDTLVIFTSDNGGLYRRYDFRAAADDSVCVQDPLKGEKGSLHEGGIRVPLIARYPRLIEAGSECSAPSISYDFFATLAELAGAELPANQTMDGHSLVPVFGQAQPAKRDLHWHYPHYHHDRPASAIRRGDWKLIEYLDGTGDRELYNLAQDLGETRNLVQQRAETTRELQQALRSWRQRVLARMPVSNPSYDPQRADQWWSLGNGKPVPSEKRQRFPQTEKD